MSVDAPASLPPRGPLLLRPRTRRCAEAPARSPPGVRLWRSLSSSSDRGEDRTSRSRGLPSHERLLKIRVRGVLFLRFRTVAAAPATLVAASSIALAAATLRLLRLGATLRLLRLGGRLVDPLLFLGCGVAVAARKRLTVVRHRRKVDRSFGEHVGWRRGVSVGA